MLKLFVWEGVFCDYADGIAFALAHTADQARELIVAAWPGSSGSPSKSEIRFERSLEGSFNPIPWRLGQAQADEAARKAVIQRRRVQCLEELAAEPTVYTGPVGFQLSGGG